MCSSVQAYEHGLDPYHAKNVRQVWPEHPRDEGKLAFTYVPVFLDSFRVLCPSMLGRHHLLFDSTLISVCLAIIAGGLGAEPLMIRFGRVVFFLGGFSGLQWAMRTGNIVILECLIMAVGILCLITADVAKNIDSGWKRTGLYIVGAALLGLGCSIKLLPFPIIFGLYFLPLTRWPKVGLILIAAVFFSLPLAISLGFYNHLFWTWVASILGHVPYQQSPATESIPPSLFGFWHTIVDTSRHGLPFILYAISILMFSFVVVVRMYAIVSPEHKKIPGGGLEHVLCSNPKFARHFVFVFMFSCLVLLPRIKSYAYLTIALLGAIVLGNLTLAGIVLTCSVAIFPAFLPIGSPFFLEFQQLISGVICSAIFIYDLPAAFRRLTPAPSVCLSRSVPNLDF